jgi:hypothetical protein
MRYTKIIHALVFILSFLGLMALAFLAYKHFFYGREMEAIKARLNQIDGVEVLHIWGHDDLILEEISARLKVENKGELVLYGLSKDVFNYPDRVMLLEIGGRSFLSFTCTGSLSVSPCLDIGKGTPLGKLIGLEFQSPGDVIAHYDRIAEVFQGLKSSPELNYFPEPSAEQYLLIKSQRNADVDPIYAFDWIEGAYDFARVLKWQYAACGQ